MCRPSLHKSENMKIYKASNDVSVMVCLPNGKSVRISFIPKTGGGSVFYTSDPDVISALEKHYRYGTLFTGTEIPEETAGTAQDVLEEKPAVTVKVVKVLDMTEAKDYLAENHGVNRTKIKTAASLAKCAESFGITFEFPADGV